MPPSQRPGRCSRRFKGRERRQRVIVGQGKEEKQSSFESKEMFIFFWWCERGGEGVHKGGKKGSLYYNGVKPHAHTKEKKERNGRKLHLLVFRGLCTVCIFFPEAVTLTMFRCVSADL